MKKYIQISVTSLPTEQDLLIATLLQIGATGFEQQDDHLIAYFDQESCEVAKVEECLAERSYTLNVLEEQNWNQVWEDNFSPVVVGSFCGIRAHFHPPVGDVVYEIIITPKMSFGTGHHDTTYLMVEHMEKLDFIGKSVFDFGTGTGILAILSYKMGASEVVATDIDHWSIENAAENFQRNGCATIELHQSAVLPGGKHYDHILANINKHVILEHLTGLKERLTAGGSLLISGILSEDEKDVVPICENLGLSLKERKQRGNWILLEFQPD